MIRDLRQHSHPHFHTMNGQVPNAGQLDLFLHSRAVVLVNDTIGALLARDLVRAAECLDRLGAEEPDHHARKALETLCRELGEWPFPFADPAQIAEAIRRLEANVLPAALATMGDKATEFMRPLWRDLAQAASAHAYDAAFPQSYSAGLYLRCGNAEAAIASAHAIAQHDDNVDALHWLAVARYRIYGLDACRIPLMRLALHRPERLSKLLSDIDDPLLNREWQAFQATCHWLDSDDGSAGAWFPAWHLIEHPATPIDCGGLASMPATRAVHAFTVIARLLELEKHGYGASLISARSRLRDLNPDMFDFYMARRIVSHR